MKRQFDELSEQLREQARQYGKQLSEMQFDIKPNEYRFACSSFECHVLQGEVSPLRPLIFVYVLDPFSVSLPDELQHYIFSHVEK